VSEEVDNLGCPNHYPESLALRAYSIDEAAQVLGVSTATIYRLVRRGELPSLKVGARTLIPVRAIDIFNEVRTCPPHEGLAMATQRRDRPPGEGAGHRAIATDSTFTAERSP
jgi:excisionase family DNA binding protein